MTRRMRGVDLHHVLLVDIMQEPWGPEQRDSSGHGGRGGGGVKGGRRRVRRGGKRGEGVLFDG